jgi:DNA-binding winged helix-turn-helix (wHTH) protein
MPNADRLAFGDFVLDRPQQRVLHRNGTMLALSPRLFGALTLLIDHAGQLLDKETLIAALWPNLVVEENNLSQVISALRRALGDDSQDSRFIQTVPRRGFRFIAPVTPLVPAAEAISGSLLPSESGGAVESHTLQTATLAFTAGVSTAPAPGSSLGGRRRWLYLAARR